MFSGYYKNDDHALIHTQYDIAINSCGRYELIHQNTFKTYRPNGRADFQLLYIARGKGYFTLDSKEHVVAEGNMVLYLPGMEQTYRYSNTDLPIIYWIHFSGFGVLDFLIDNNFDHGFIFFLGLHTELTLIFDKMISELNLARTHFFKICNLYVKELITLSARYLLESSGTRYKKDDMLEEAIKYFNENSNLEISIKDYADQHNMSCCWFIRHFKSYTGTTPAHYITNIRISKAKSLLNNGALSINQIASIVGYDNALYFSRIFKKYVGVSPKHFTNTFG